MNNRPWMILAISLVLLASLLLLACQATTTAPTQAPAPAPTQAPAPAPTQAPAPAPTQAAQTQAPGTATPKTGGILKIGTFADAVSLGEIQLGASLGGDTLLALPATEGLATIDAQANLVPWLATSWQVDSKALTCTLSLRKGVRFSDGTDFNATAVKYVWQKLIDHKVASVTNVASIDIVDDYTVRANYKTWDPNMPSNLTRDAGVMVSPTAWAKNGDDWIMQNPVGTGPFKLASRQRDVNIKYVKNPDYWQKGKPYLDGLEFDIIPDQMTRLAAFMAGEVDISLDPTIAQAQGLKGNSKYVIQHFPGGTGSMRFAPDGNDADSVFHDVRCRQAVAYALNLQSLVDDVLGGFATVTNQWTPPGSWGYNPAIKGYPYDPAKAKALLTEAGYPNGFEMSIIGRDVGVDPPICTAVQAMLAKVGIKANLNLQANLGYTSALTGGWKNGMVLVNAPGTAWTIPFGFQYVVKTGRKIWVSIPNVPEIDQVGAQILTAPDFDTEKAYTQQLMQLIFEKYVQTIPIYLQDSICLKYPYAQGDGFYSTILNGQWTPDTAWLNR